MLYQPRIIPNQSHPSSYAFPSPQYSQLTSLQIPNSPQLSQVFYSNSPLENINCICEPHQQIGGLYLGDVLCLIKKEILDRNQIKSVLTCLNENEASRANINLNTSISPCIISHKTIPMRDSLDYLIDQHFDETFQFIENARNAGQNVLIHCHAGVSRSAAVVCAYLMKKDNILLEQSLGRLRTRRRRAKPNENFMKRLKSYEQKLHKNNSNSQVKQSFPMSSEQTKDGLEKCDPTPNQLSTSKKLQESSIGKNPVHLDYSFMSPKKEQFETNMTRPISQSRCYQPNQTSRSNCSDTSNLPHHQFNGEYTIFSCQNSLANSNGYQKGSRIVQGSRVECVNETRKEENYEGMFSPKMSIARQNNKKSILDIERGNTQTVSKMTMQSPDKDKKYSYKMKDNSKQHKKVMPTQQKKPSDSSNCFLEGLRQLCF